MKSVERQLIETDHPTAMHAFVAESEGHAYRASGGRARTQRRRARCEFGEMSDGDVEFSTTFSAHTISGFRDSREDSRIEGE